MASLHIRTRPIIYICHLYGMGHCFCDRFSMFNYILILINLTNATYVYFSIYKKISAASDMYDLSTIMVVVRLHFRFLTPMIMIICLNVNKAVILCSIETLDHLIPSIRNISLKPFLLHFVGWIFITLAAEFLQILAFHVRTNFEYFLSLKLFVIFVFSNIWIVTPVLQYMYLMSMIFYGIRNINENITAIQMWKIHRSQWKELQHLAMHLTKSVFGEIIIIFIGFTIMDITFFCFAIYLSWKFNYVYEEFGYIVMILVRAGLVIQLFRTCHYCNIEVIKIKIIHIVYKSIITLMTVSDNIIIT